MKRKKYFGTRKLEDNWKPSEIPRDLLESQCYGGHPVLDCKYRQSTSCPRACRYLEQKKVFLNGLQRFKKRYPEYNGIS